jgi:hypothetical protein
MHMRKEQSSSAVCSIPAQNKGGRKRCWRVGRFTKLGKQRSTCRSHAQHVSLFWHSLVQRVPCYFALMRVCSIHRSHKVKLRVVIYCREMKYWTAVAIQERKYEDVRIHLKRTRSQRKCTSQTVCKSGREIKYWHVIIIQERNQSNSL